MTNRLAIRVVLPVVLAALIAAPRYAAAQSTVVTPGGAADDSAVSGAVEQKPLLTPSQRSAIYAEVAKDKSKASPKNFSPVAGADVPPMIELYTLPDEAVADVPAAKMYKYTLVENKVVLVDPTRMRVIDVIGPSAPPAH
ncbi:MAG TPA: DUF1236 domain-containing protein [Xanthobacteraceae bacterium]